MSRPHKPKGPPRVGGKIDHPDLFVWAWAKAIPATLDALLGDVSAVSVRAAPGFFLAFLTIWLTLAEDSPLKPVLGISTLATLLCAVIALYVRAHRSQLLPSRAIAWHSVAVVGVGLATAFVVASGLHQDWVRSSARQENATKQREDDVASRAAATEAKKQAQIALDAAARAAAAKDEAAKASEAAKARIAEAACLQAREDAIQKATSSQWSARKAAEDCKNRYNETLITLQTAREFCKGAYGRLDGARAQLAEASSKACGPDNMGSTGSIDRAK